MHTFTLRIGDHINRKFQANTVQGAKRKASNLYPTIQGTWRRANGVTYMKSGGTGTMYLLIPHELA